MNKEYCFCNGHVPDLLKSFHLISFIVNVLCVTIVVYQPTHIKKKNIKLVSLLIFYLLLLEGT